MIGPNLSEWALKHRSFVVFMMLAITVIGLSSYYRLGRNEDPAFTFRTMIVQAAWPGATMEDTLTQVTERIERKLQETTGLDYLRSYTTPGLTTIFVNLKGSTSPKEVPDIWYQVRKNIGDIRGSLPQGVVGPGFNDDFGDTYGLIYGFTADNGFSHRELRDYVEEMRSKLLQVPDVSKIEILGAQNEQIYVEFSTRQLAGLEVAAAGLDVGPQHLLERDVDRLDRGEAPRLGAQLRVRPEPGPQPAPERPDRALALASRRLHGRQQGDGGGGEEGEGDDDENGHAAIVRPIMGRLQPRDGASRTRHETFTARHVRPARPPAAAG